MAMCKLAIAVLVVRPAQPAGERLDDVDLSCYGPGAAFTVARRVEFERRGYPSWY